MKRIACFSIPAHGHTNPMLPVVKELVNRGDRVRFYSFDEFEEKITATGAEFVSCSKYLPELSAEEEQELKNINTTEMTIQDIRITLAMNDFMSDEFNSFKPDVVYTDAVCFWGKLNAWKFEVPMVVSTSTFAFNELSSKYMKMSSKELSDMIFGLPKISKEIKTLRPYGYKQKSALSLVRNDNSTDSIVYTSRRFQPYSESFSDHYLFAGPSVFSNAVPNKQKDRPLVYISMGTIINDRPDFYTKCISALKNENVEVIISCGKFMDAKTLEPLPENVKVYPCVDQLDVLSRASAFITHCGMNSVSESLYMAAPMVLYPQTSEQQAVARRVTEINAGVMLADDSVEGIRAAVLSVLNNSEYAKSAQECSRDFRSCPGVRGAADFVENAPHESNGFDIFKELDKANGKFQLCYWLMITALILLFGFTMGWRFVWIIGVSGGVLNYPISSKYRMIQYKKITEKMNL